MKLVDLTGKVFSDLTVIEYVGDRKWKCKCSCGKTIIAFGSNLRNGAIHSCGHDNTRAFKDITGEQFGDWKVIKYAGDGYWECKCSCGNIKNVAGWHLRGGRSTSCGHGNTGCTRNSFKETKQIDKIVPLDELKPGLKINEWTLIEKVDSRYWRCKCSCGNVANVSTWALRKGRSKSCGKCKSNDIIGKQFGEWTVLEKADAGRYKCECSCGEIREVLKRSLLDGTSKSCGGKSHRLPGLIGEKFGYLNVLNYIGNGYYRCKCDCGNIKDVLGCNLVAGTTISCGCKRHTVTFTKDVIESSALRFRHEKCRYPNVKELADYIGVNSGHLSYLLKKYELQDVVTHSCISSYENDIYNFISQIDSGIEIIRSDRSVLSGIGNKELDIYIPSKRLAIEFNGDYWHSDLFKSSGYHSDKVDKCNELGIHLISIFEHEWINEITKGKIENYIKNLVKEDQNKIYARDCQIGFIKKDLAKQFIEKNHLQGSCNFQVSIGLVHNGEIVGIMAFGKPRFNSKYQYELLRYCNSNSVSIIGGAERMFKYFVDKYNPKSVISYCDRSKFTGNVYNKLGFINSGNTPANYSWVSRDLKTVLSRYETQKSRLISIGYSDYGKTENEIMQNLGYLKVYDCGNIRFIWEHN